MAAKVKKLNLLDSRWASNLEDQVAKADRQLARIEKTLKSHAKTVPVAKHLRNIQTARRELATVGGFAKLTRGVLRNTDEVRG
jgi:hypothetical protein